MNILEEGGHGARVELTTGTVFTAYVNHSCTYVRWDVVSVQYGVAWDCGWVDACDDLSLALLEHPLNVCMLPLLLWLHEMDSRNGTHNNRYNHTTLHHPIEVSTEPDGSGVVRECCKYLVVVLSTV